MRPNCHIQIIFLLSFRIRCALRPWLVVWRHLRVPFHLAKRVLDEPDGLFPTYCFIISSLVLDSVKCGGLVGTGLLEEVVETRFAVWTRAGSEGPRRCVEQQGYASTGAEKGVSYHDGAGLCDLSTL